MKFFEHARCQDFGDLLVTVLRQICHSHSQCLCWVKICSDLRFSLKNCWNSKESQVLPQILTATAINAAEIHHNSLMSRVSVYPLSVSTIKTRRLVIGDMHVSVTSHAMCVM